MSGIDSFVPAIIFRKWRPTRVVSPLPRRRRPRLPLLRPAKRRTTATTTPQKKRRRRKKSRLRPKKRRRKKRKTMTSDPQLPHNHKSRTRRLSPFLVKLVNSFIVGVYGIGVLYVQILLQKGKAPCHSFLSPIDRVFVPPPPTHFIFRTASKILTNFAFLI